VLLRCLEDDREEVGGGEGGSDAQHGPTEGRERVLEARSTKEVSTL